MAREAKRGAALAFAALLACSLAGCAGSAGSQEDAAETDGGASASQDAEGKDAGATTFVDDTGVEVSVDDPQRVVACMGSFANIWELAGGTLAGASDDAFESYDLASPDVRNVGDFAALDLEAIIALEPDFVIMTSGTGGRGGDSSQVDLRPALEASGIPVACFEVTTFDDYLRMLRICCDITGQDDRYRQNGQEVADRIAAIEEDVPDGERPTALLMTTFSGGTRVQTSSSMAGAMLADLGAVNLADENPSLLKDFSLESVIELDPDFIFVVPMGNDDEAALRALEDQTAENPAWSSLAAVQSGRYLTLDPSLFLYKPNARWDEGYQALYDALYR